MNTARRSTDPLGRASFVTRQILHAVALTLAITGSAWPSWARSGRASADNIPTDGLLQPTRLGLLLGYDIREAVGPYDLGFGVRAGYALDFGLYFGGTFVYHLSESATAQCGRESTSGFHYFGIEIGYRIDAGPIEAIPYLGLGSICASGDSDSAFYLAPGWQVLFPLGSAFIGADVRYMSRRAAEGSSLFLTGGMSF